MEQVIGYVRYAWKAIVALLIPLAWTLAVDLVDQLQGTFADNMIFVAVLTSLGVWLKANGPKPEPSGGEPED